MTAQVLMVTCGQFPHLTADDQLLSKALKRRGVTTAPVCWDDPATDWSRCRIALLRSSWDYVHRYEAFNAWLSRVHSQTMLINLVELVRWNIHKGYLLELASRGISCVLAKLITRGLAGIAGEILRPMEWTDVVIKPAVSASAYKTLRIRNMAGPDAQEAEVHLRDIFTRTDALVQPYMPEVNDIGERASFSSTASSVTPIAKRLSIRASPVRRNRWKRACSYLRRSWTSRGACSPACPWRPCMPASTFSRMPRSHADGSRGDRPRFTLPTSPRSG